MDKARQKKLKPYFDQLVKHDSIDLPEIARRTGINYSYVLTFFSIYLRGLSNRVEEDLPKIKAVILTPDGFVQTYGGDNRYVPHLSGACSAQLHEQIKSESDTSTRWSGFEEKQLP